LSYKPAEFSDHIYMVTSNFLLSQQSYTCSRQLSICEGILEVICSCVHGKLCV